MDVLKNQHKVSGAWYGGLKSNQIKVTEGGNVGNQTLKYKTWIWIHLTQINV